MSNLHKQIDAINTEIEEIELQVKHEEAIIELLNIDTSAREALLMLLCEHLSELRTRLERLKQLEIMVQPLTFKEMVELALDNQNKVQSVLGLYDAVLPSKK